MSIKCDADLIRHTMKGLVLLEERKIIQRLKQGDIASLEMLVQTHQEKAIRTAYLITQDKALAHDVVQATFITVYKAIDTFDSQRPFEPYFMRSVVHAAVRASKKQQRSISLETFVEEHGYLDDLVSGADNPETILADREQTEEIQALLKQLSPQKRAVIVMKYYLGYSEIEIAEKLNTPHGTIKSRLYKARQQLKRLFKTQQVAPRLKEDLG